MYPVDVWPPSRAVSPRFSGAGPRLRGHIHRRRKRSGRSSSPAIARGSPLLPACGVFYAHPAAPNLWNSCPERKRCVSARYRSGLRASRNRSADAPPPGTIQPAWERVYNPADSVVNPRSSRGRQATRNGGPGGPPGARRTQSPFPHAVCEGRAGDGGGGLLPADHRQGWAAGRPLPCAVTFFLSLHEERSGEGPHPFRHLRPRR
jgi:hypothetical protein